MAIEKDDIIGALKTVFDPEIPVNIWDMGLVYDIKIDGKDITITMTLTSPTCPMMDELVGQVKNAVLRVAGVEKNRFATSSIGKFPETTWFTASIIGSSTP